MPLVCYSPCTQSKECCASSMQAAMTAAQQSLTAILQCKTYLSAGVAQDGAQS